MLIPKSPLALRHTSASDMVPPGVLADPRKPYIPRGVLCAEYVVKPPVGEKRPCPPGVSNHANEFAGSYWIGSCCLKPLPKSLAKLVGVIPVVLEPARIPDWVFLGVRGAKNIPGESKSLCCVINVCWEGGKKQMLEKMQKK